MINSGPGRNLEGAPLTNKMKYFRWRFPFIFLFIGSVFLNVKLQKSSESLKFLRDATDEFKTDIFAGGPDLDEVINIKQNHLMFLHLGVREDSISGYFVAE